MTGAEPIGFMRTLLDRVVALRTGGDPARKATKAANKAAVELLAKRSNAWLDAPWLDASGERAVRRGELVGRQGRERRNVER